MLTVDEIKSDMKNLSLQEVMKDGLVSMERGHSRLNVAAALSESVGNLKIDTQTEPRRSSSKKTMAGESKPVPRLPFKQTVPETSNQESPSVLKEILPVIFPQKQTVTTSNPQLDTHLVEELEDDFDDMPELELAVREESPEVPEVVGAAAHAKNPNVSPQ